VPSYSPVPLSCGKEKLKYIILVARRVLGQLPEVALDDGIFQPMILVSSAQEASVNSSRPSREGTFYCEALEMVARTFTRCFTRT
jgi:hypothetical protein